MPPTIPPITPPINPPNISSPKEAFLVEEGSSEKLPNIAATPKPAAAPTIEPTNIPESFDEVFFGNLFFIFLLDAESEVKVLSEVFTVSECVKKSEISEESFGCAKRFPVRKIKTSEKIRGAFIFVF